MKKHYLLSCKAIIAFGLLFACTTAGALAQNVSLSHTEKIEQATYNITQQILAGVKQQTGITTIEAKEFEKYYEDSLAFYHARLFWGLMHNTINGLNQQQYINATETHYVELVNQYKKIKAEYPQAIDEARRPQPVTAGACNPACDNIDFENGTLSAWTACWADCSAENTYPNDPGAFFNTAPTCSGPLGAVTQSANDSNTSSYQVSVTSGAGTDPVGGFPVVAPGFGNYSVRVGDGTNYGFGVAFLEQTFQVTAANSDFYYAYAVVLQNPLGHTYHQQPYCQICMLDQNGDTIGNNLLVSGSNTGGANWVQIAYGGEATYYLPWTTSFIPLKKYIGQCVTIIVKTADCGQGGHFGYAYFDCKCQSNVITTSATSICKAPITLTAPSGASSYSWSGPCIVGSSSTQSITASCPGKYTVIMKGVMGASDADTLDTLIVSGTGSSPTPYFKADTVCYGNPTQFTNFTSPSTGNTYSWNFGDPASGPNDTSSAVNPVHTFFGPGIFKVTLRASDSTVCYSDTTIDVAVNDFGAAGFKSSASVACANTAVVFTDTSLAAVSWKWNFGDGGTSKLQNPSHTFSTPGTYTVTLVINSPCADTAKHVITISAAPTLTITASSGAICSGNSDTLKASGATGYVWSTKATTSAITVAPLTNTKYTVTGTNGGCSAKDSITVTVNASPVIKTSPVSAGICPGGSVNITASGATSYTWSPATALNATTGATVTANPSATQTYTVTGANATCRDSNTVTVNVSATLTVTVTPAAPAVCQGSNVTLNGAGAATYTWKPVTGLNCTTCASVVATPTAPTTYTLVGTSSTCADSANVTVNVNPLPTITVAATGTSHTICKGDTIGLIAGGATTYAWSPSASLNASTGVHVVATPSAKTKYTVTGTNGNGCVNNDTITIGINYLPVVFVTGTSPINPGTADTLSATGAVNYVWSSGSNADTARVSPSSTQTYTVIGTDGNGCKDTASFTVVVNTITSAPAVNANTGSTVVYPNPAREIINMTFTVKEGSVPATIKVLDIMGRELAKENTTLHNGRVLSMNVSSLAPGLYFVQVITNEQTRVVRFVKQ